MLFELVTLQPIPLTSWRVIANQVKRDSFPRVASFNTGEYAVVYGVRNDAANAVDIVCQIFNPDGSVKVAPKAISSTTSTNYAPNIIRLDDVFVNHSISVDSAIYLFLGQLFPGEVTRRRTFGLQCLTPMVQSRNTKALTKSPLEF